MAFQYGFKIEWQGKILYKWKCSWGFSRRKKSYPHIQK